MEEKQLEFCMKTMEDLCNHPITRTFHEPVPTGEDEPTNYHNIIKKPIDLGTIRKNLQDNKYNIIQEWLDDVELVWKNAEIYNEPTSLVAINAKESRRIFEKLIRKAYSFLMGTWCSEAFRLKNKISEIIQNAPSGKIKSVTQNSNNSKQQKQNATLFTENDMVNFVKASEMLPSLENQRDMLKIIDDNQPEIDNGNQHVDIDITKLNLTTLHALQDYMRTTIEKSGLKYPE